MMEYFAKDPWVMLENPPTFRPGVLPMDGVTGEMVTSPDKTTATRD
jgi:hypothetical protein